MKKVATTPRKEPVALAVERVGNLNLCAGCGICVPICPSEAVAMSLVPKGIYLPVVDPIKCTNCGLCVQVCPGHSLRLDQFEDVLLGDHLNSYMGYSTDSRVRWESSSGGLVTELLLFMLDEGIIDGALVTRASRTSPLTPEPFIARTRQDIVQAMGSKYCPVPADIRFTELLSEKGKFAVVGLPCDIEGIRNVQRINQSINRRLARRIVLVLGLFCANTSSILGTQFLLRKHSITAEQVAELTYRGHGWPGHGSILLKNGRVIDVTLNEWYRTGGLPFFKPIRCMLCFDNTNRLADISFGDAWKLSNDSAGMSLVISRSELAERILQQARREQRIALLRVDPSDVVKSQNLQNRMNQFAGRTRVWNRILRQSVPVRLKELPRVGLLDMIYALFYCMLIRITQNGCIQGLLMNATMLPTVAMVIIRDRRSRMIEP
jgi:coenzyme F420 hydrogenase subunit beta